MTFTNRILSFIILILLLSDVVYSFRQHYSAGLDGDLSVIVLPSDWYSEVLQDPFGWNVLLNNEVYAAPNRFFVHWTMGAYFKNIPLWLQSFMTPVDSVYVSCAIAKTLIQAGMVLVLSLYILRLTKKSGISSFLLAAILITPLFQTSGYNVMMGIIDKSITYTFFYAAPMLVLLIFFLPFSTRDWHTERKGLGWGTHLLLLVLLVILPFSGPLIPGVVLIVCSSVLCYFWWKEFRSDKEVGVVKRAVDAVVSIPGPFLFYFILISFLSLYSLYIGTHNAENLGETISLSERFSRIPMGVINLLIQKLGLPLLLLMIGINMYVLRKYHRDDSQANRIRMVLKLVGLFVLIYLLLLPFGGYRSYRPNILRRDTVMPVYLSLFLLYGWSTYYLIHYVRPQLKKGYIAISLFFIIAFTAADNPGFEDNYCERRQLENLAKATDEIVLLESDCKIMSWNNMTDYKNSEINCLLLQHWGVIKGKKYYYQK